MTTVRLFFAQFLLWLLTLTTPALGHLSVDGNAANMKSSAINLTMADVHDGVGDLELGEGSFEHDALHGLLAVRRAKL
ncbi:hypothetical protein ACJ5NV_20510 [Loktanella agnita]